MVAPAVPQRVGRYEIVGELARGGMAELYLARLPGIDGFAKQVVIKRVLPELVRDPSVRQMLLEEARLVATLDHQNIVRIHDVGDDNGYFLVMELLQGADVGSLLSAVTARGTALPPPIAIEIARGALAGLHYAHERCGPDGTPLGLVHRDISPQNLFVTFDGAIKLLDFGIAKAVERPAGARASRTQTGAIRGKIPYMSPEQCNAERLDRRSDVFSLSIVLWEMTTGQRLYGGNDDSELATMKSIVDRDAPRPSTLVPGYPPELEQLVMTGLSRDRDARFATADAMQLELEQLARAKGWWTSARELAAFVAEAFPDRAAVWRDSSQRGTSPVVRLADAVLGPRVTAPMPAEPRVTAPMPVEPARSADAARSASARSADAAQSAQRGQPEPRVTAPMRSGSAGRAADHATTERDAVRAGIAASASAPSVANPPHSAANSAANPLPPHSAANPPHSVANPSATRPRNRAMVVMAFAMVIAASIVVAFAIGRGTRTTGDRNATGGATNTGATNTGATNAGAIDAHFFQPDDVLIHPRDGYKGERLDFLSVAKPLGNDRYLDGNGKEVITTHTWKTRVATDRDLVIGTLAFCQAPSYLYKAKPPIDERTARGQPWMLGRITDIAQVGSGHVTVADVVCDTRGVRVIAE